MNNNTNINLATEIINDLKTKLRFYRVLLTASFSTIIALLILLFL